MFPRSLARRIGRMRALTFVLMLGVLVTGALLPFEAGTQSASFSGLVLMDGSERPLEGAEITFTKLKRSVRSDSAGAFLFTGLPKGKHEVLVRMVGYESIATDVVLSDGKPLEIDLLLRPSTPKLDAVEVKATASPYATRLMDFEERRSTKTGRYITSDVFGKEAGRPLSAIITQKIPGVKTVPVNGRSFLASLRGGRMKGCEQQKCPATMEKMPPNCYMQIVVDGIIRWNGIPTQAYFDIDQISSQDVIGFEFYTTATTPVRYRGTGGELMGACGTVIIWTKGG